MAEHRIGALLVMRDEQLLGVVSERDYARKVILQGRSSSQATVGEIMHNDPLTVGPQTDVLDCMRRVISIGDLVKAVIDAQAEQIEHLERYITG
jgi:CBS domain-containing protein